jgi:hypothetical protein
MSDRPEGSGPTRRTEACGCVYNGAVLTRECDGANTPAYIGRKPCGCAVAAVVAEPPRIAEWTPDVREFIRTGLTVEPSTVGFVRHGGLVRCPHGKPKTRRAALRAAEGKHDE